MKLIPRCKSSQLHQPPTLPLPQSKHPGGPRKVNWPSLFKRRVYVFHMQLLCVVFSDRGPRTGGKIGAINSQSRTMTSSTELHASPSLQLWSENSLHLRTFSISRRTALIRNIKAISRYRIKSNFSLQRRELGVCSLYDIQQAD